jgi:hypothetical protein
MSYEQVSSKATCFSCFCLLVQTLHCQRMEYQTASGRGTLPEASRIILVRFLYLSLFKKKIIIINFTTLTTHLPSKEITFFFSQSA